MNREFPFSLGFFLIASALIVEPFGAQAPAGPKLSISESSARSVTLSWTNTASAFALERANLFTFPTLWQVVSQIPVEQGGQFSVSLQPNGVQFFRLHVPDLTHVISSSPLNGEQDVAVLRETIVQFSAPLSATATLAKIL